MDFKKLVPYILSLLGFVVITAIYFKPVFDKKEIKQGDIINFNGMSKEIIDHREKYNEEPLWTNSMFGGMPAFQISVLYKNNLIQYLDKVLRIGLPHPAGFVFLYFLGFYILLSVLGVNHWLRFLGAIAFGFSSYFFIIIEAGHNSKAHAIAYMAPVVAGVILTFRGQLIQGGILTALALSLELLANHLQITYYLTLFLLIYGLTTFISVVKEKQFAPFIKSCAVIIGAVLLAAATNAGNLLSTYEYGKHTTRGKSELTFDKENKTTGLDKDYAMGWSYGVGETFSLLVPDFKGGGSGAVGEEKSALKAVKDPQMKQAVAQMDRYWGDQPFTSGPVYAGAVIIFLFVLGCLLVNGPLKQALIAATLLSVMLSWGSNFRGFSEFFLDHFPGYNKFRAVSMILVIAEFTIPLLAVLALDQFMKNKESLKETFTLPLLKKTFTKQQGLIMAFVLTGGLCLLFYVSPEMFNSFSKSNEVEKTVQQISRSAPDAKEQDIMRYVTDIMPELESARIAIFKSDALRSFMLITLAAGIIFLYFKSNLEKKYILAAITFIVLTDMWMVDKRYLNNKNFVTKQEAKVPYTLSVADQFILEDKDPDFRVLNIAANTFNDAGTSYFHKSLGGYHGAKLKRYQELIEYQLDPAMQRAINTLRTNPDDSSLRVMFSQQPILNMLNMKYLIYNPETRPLENRYALGNAWFVNQIKYVPTADSEITALSDFDARKTAIIDARFKETLQNYNPSNASGEIKLTDYKANYLTYESKTTAEQLAVFSEIYYADGWNAYIDGQLTDHVRANYVLRAMKIPAGNHTIEFKFEPATYKTGEAVSLVCSSLVLLLAAVGLFLEMKKIGSRQ